MFEGTFLSIPLYEEVSIVNQLTKQHVVVNRPNQQTILVNDGSCSKWQFFSIIYVYFTNFVVRKCYPGYGWFSKFNLKNLRRTGMTDISAVENCVRYPRDSHKPKISRQWVNVDVVNVWIKVDFLFGLKTKTVLSGRRSTDIKEPMNMRA